jgi:hypothetical protein
MVVKLNVAFNWGITRARFQGFPLVRSKCANPGARGCGCASAVVVGSMSAMMAAGAGPRRSFSFRIGAVDIGRKY